MDEITMERRQSADGQGKEELVVSGSLTIAEAARFKEGLLASLQAAGELLVDLGGVTAIDITGLQLLCAAHGSAEQAGKGFRIKDSGDGVLGKAVAEAGFQRHVGCARDNKSSCIWVGGGN